MSKNSTNGVDGYDLIERDGMVLDPTFDGKQGPESPGYKPANGGLASEPAPKSSNERAPQWDTPSGMYKD